jgi:hypothetical protein
MTPTVTSDGAPLVAPDGAPSTGVVAFADTLSQVAASGARCLTNAPSPRRLKRFP